MKMKTNRLIMVLTAVAGLLASPCFAATQAENEAGMAVSAAAKAIYADSTASAAVIQAALIDLLNEAEATGNKETMKFAIVAVVAAGGINNVELSKAAVDNSNVFKNHKDLATMTVSQTILLMRSPGKSQNRSTAGSGNQGQGGGTKIDGTSGGGNGNGTPFDLDSFFRLLDRDLPATRT